MKNRNLKQKNFGLSFSGGGVHSWAEAAVYEELERKNIEVNAVVGTSMGSFLAAAVASGLSAEEIYEVINKTDTAITESKLFSHRAILNLFSLRQPMGLVLIEKLAEIIKPVDRLYNEVMLSDIPKPLAIPAVDIMTKKIIIFSNQPEYFKQDLENVEFYDKDIPLIKACLASSAYPIMLTPVRIDDYQLIDGGVMLNSPAVLFSEKHIDYVLATRIEAEELTEPIDRHLEVGLRAIEIMIENQEELTSHISSEDYMMNLPLPSTFEFGGSYEIIQAGKDFIKENPLNISAVFEDESV